MGVKFKKGVNADAMVCALPWGAYLGEEGLKKGIRVAVSSWRRLAPDTIPTEAKAAGNYLSSILIANEVTGNGYDDGCNVNVVEGISGSDAVVIMTGLFVTEYSVLSNQVAACRQQNKEIIGSIVEV